MGSLPSRQCPMSPSSMNRDNNDRQSTPRSEVFARFDALDCMIEEFLDQGMSYNETVPHQYTPWSRSISALPPQLPELRPMSTISLAKLGAAAAANQVTFRTNVRSVQNEVRSPPSRNLNEEYLNSPLPPVPGLNKEGKPAAVVTRHIEPQVLRPQRESAHSAFTTPAVRRSIPSVAPLNIIKRNKSTICWPTTTDVLRGTPGYHKLPCCRRSSQQAARELELKQKSSAPSSLVREYLHDNRIRSPLSILEALALDPGSDTGAIVAHRLAQPQAFSA